VTTRAPVGAATVLLIVINAAGALNAAGAPNAAAALKAADAAAMQAESAEGAVSTTPDPAPAPQQPYVPIDAEQRVDWIVGGTIGPRTLGVGVLATAWQTGWNTPDEWGRSWSGAAKRYSEREADVAISNTIEAGLGAIWGEEPRYIPAPPGTVRSRTRHALKTVMLAQRRDGHLAPAWGRYAGNVLNNLIENTWLPPSVTTPRQTAIRSAEGLLARLVENLWEEFWPDIRRRIRR
jgi:hypothetical protein